MSKDMKMYGVYEVVGFQLLGDFKDQIPPIGKARCKYMRTEG